MPQYRWSEGKIAQTEVTPSVAGFSARVHARSHTDADDLATVQALLNRRHIASFIDTSAHGNALIVPQLSNEAILPDLLQSSGLVQGTLTRTPLAADVANKQSFLQKHPTLLSGLMFDVGGLAFIGSGIQRARHNRNGKFTKADMGETMVGVVWVFANLLLAFFGEHKTKHPMLAYSDALHAHLQKHGIGLPLTDDTTPEALANHTGLVGAVHNFVVKHAVETVSLMKMAGGGFLVLSGTKKDNLNIRKMAAGTIFATGWLATFAFDNQKHLPYQFKAEEEEKQNRGMLEKATHWVKDNPRAHITAPFATTHNLLTLWGAFVERGKVGAAMKAAAGTAEELRYLQGKQYDYLWNVVSESCYIVGNFLFGLSGKQKGNVKDMDAFSHEMLVVSANTLANIPEAVRTTAIAETAEYIASIKGVHAKKEDIAQQISDKAKEICKLHPIAISQQLSR